MAKVKPLISDDPKPQNMQFSHFGVLNDGSQSKGSLLTSVMLNVLLALCANGQSLGRLRFALGTSRSSATRRVYDLLKLGWVEVDGAAQPA